MRRAAASVFDPVEGLLEFLLVASPESEDAAAAVELIAHVLVHLAELVQLTCNVIVLELNNLCVLLQGVLLGQVVYVLSAENLVVNLALLQILTLEEELILTVL